MKKTLIGLFALLTVLAQSSFAGCPCQRDINPCDMRDPCPKVSPCTTPDPCEMNKLSGCTDWLTQTSLEGYFNRMNLDQAQKCEAMNAIENFMEKTENINIGDCATKCDCRNYRHALKDLDCDMKNIITSCQKSDYRAVRKEVKNQVKCCYKCSINPFTRCTSCK